LDSNAGVFARLQGVCCRTSAYALLGRLNKNKRERVMIRVSPAALEPIRLAEARAWLGLTDDNDTDQDGEIWAVLESDAPLRREIYRPALLRYGDLELNCSIAGRALHRAPGRAGRRDRLRQVSRYGRRPADAFYDSSVRRSRRGPGPHRSRARSRPDPAGLRRALADAARRTTSTRSGSALPRATGPAARRRISPSFPDELKLWLRVRLATLFENREAIIRDDRLEIPRNYNDALLDPLMLGRRIG
jgi:hypothetical protein